jgi:hypothetical protein
VRTGEKDGREARMGTGRKAKRLKAREGRERVERKGRRT